MADRGARGRGRGAPRGAPRGGRGASRGRGGASPSPASRGRGGPSASPARGRGAPARGRGGPPRGGAVRGGRGSSSPARGASASPRGGRGGGRGAPAVRGDRGGRGGRGRGGPDRGAARGAPAGRGVRGGRGGRGGTAPTPASPAPVREEKKSEEPKSDGEHAPKKPAEVPEEISNTTKHCYIVDLSHIIGKAHSSISKQIYQLVYSELSDDHFVVIVARSRPHLSCDTCNTAIHAPVTVTPRRRLLQAPRPNATAFALAFEAARLHHLLPKNSAMHVITNDKSAECLLQPLQQLARTVHYYQQDSLSSLPLPELPRHAALANVKGGEQASDLIRDMETVMPRVYKWLENASINSPAGLPSNLTGLLRMVSPMCTIREPANVQHILHIILSRSYASLCPVCSSFCYSDVFLKRELQEPDSKTATAYEKKVHAVLLQLRECLAHHPNPPDSIEEMALMIKTYVYKSRVDPAQVVAVLIADQLVEVSTDNHVSFKTVRPPVLQRAH